MEIHVAQQTGAFLRACLLGGALGLLYDCFRILRLAFPHTRDTRWGYALAFAEDILFFGLCAGASFLFMMETVHGQVRLFLLAGELLGAVLWHYTAGSVVLAVSHALLRGIKAVLAFLFRFFLRPFWRICYRIVYLLCQPLRFLAQIVKKTAIKAKFHLKTRGIVLYNYFVGHRVSPAGETKGAHESEQ